MHPLLVLVILFSVKNGIRRPSDRVYIWKLPALPGISRLSFPKPEDINLTYFDTFRMELFLDRMRNLTEGLEALNRLRQYGTVDTDAAGIVNRLEASLLAAKKFLADTRVETQIDQLSNIVETVRNLGNPEDWMEAMGPLLSGMVKMTDFDGK